jgi:hypothetical protein
MTTPDKLTFELLADWVENRLAPAAAQAVAQEVANAAPELQAQVDWLRAFGRLHPAIKLAPPPAALRATLISAFAQQSSAQARPGLIQRLLASLRFDSALQPAVAGLRAAEFGRTRQLVYATDVADVAVNLQPRPLEQRVDVLGQILLNDGSVAPDEFSVQLLRETEEVGMTLADDLGEFAFAGLQPGRYQLILSTDTLDIQLPAFELLR